MQKVAGSCGCFLSQLEVSIAGSAARASDAGTESVEDLEGCHVERVALDWITKCLKGEIGLRSSGLRNRLWYSTAFSFCFKNLLILCVWRFAYMCVCIHVPRVSSAPAGQRLKHGSSGRAASAFNH